MHSSDDLGAVPLLIGGDETDASDGGSFPTLNPATGEVIAFVARGTGADVDRAVSSATSAMADWLRWDPRDRGECLLRLADLITKEADRLARLESRDNGRPIRETTAQFDLIPKFYRYFAGLADKIEGKTIPVSGAYHVHTVRVPVGVCAAITPWNHPQLILAKKIAPALAAGNAVIVKPSELAPLSTIELGRLALAAGFPPGIINVVSGGAETGAALAAHPGVARVDVTGSTATGAAVAAAASPNLTRLGFELGGKAANLVFADVDMERAVRGAAFSAFVAQGQSCVAGSRVLVDRSLADEFAYRLAEFAERIRLGDPGCGSTQMGPLISGSAAARVRGMIARAMEQGASILTGGANVPTGLDRSLCAENFVAPTVMRLADDDSEIARDEVFGPVAAVIPFDDEQHAVEMANAVPYGLGAGIWTNDVSRAHRVSRDVRAGVTWINDYHRNDPGVPWGGFGLSGYGRENGIDAIAEFTEVKSTWVPLESTTSSWYDGEEARLN